MLRPSSPAFETEKIAYWFFRINGCLNITNFLVHHERRGQFGTDVDVLAVRFPFRRELAMSERPMEDHPVFYSAGKIDLIICEVKSGLCALNGPWTDPEKMNMHRVLFSLGAFPEKQVPDVADAMYEDKYFENEVHRVRLFAVGTRRNRGLSDTVAQLTWEEILAFIYERFKVYRYEKAQHDQWDTSGKWLFDLTLKNRTTKAFVRDVVERMGISA